MAIYRNYVFLHLPKTGGSAFRAAICALGTASPQYVDIADLTVEPLEDYDFINGHVSRTTWLQLFPHRRALTILREPIERCVSQYWYQRAHDPATAGPNSALARHVSIEGMAEQTFEHVKRSYENRMTRQLGGHVLDYDTPMKFIFEAAKDTLNRAAWVGFNETIETDLTRLRCIPGFESLPPLERVNVTRDRGGASDEARAMFAARNEYDIALYEWARAQFS